MAICLLFVRTLRLPSLKLATLFLGLMFLYDIFMVMTSAMTFGMASRWPPDGLPMASRWFPDGPLMAC